MTAKGSGGAAVTAKGRGRAAVTAGGGEAADASTTGGLGKGGGPVDAFSAANPDWVVYFQSLAEELSQGVSSRSQGAESVGYNSDDDVPKATNDRC